MTSEEFRAYRRLLGLSQSQAAALLCVSRSQVSRYELAGGPHRQAVPELVARAMRWFIAGFRPPEWPSRPARFRPRQAPPRKYLPEEAAA